MNRREIFDIVKEHMLRQGKKCVNQHGDCVYRNNGDRCALGCLIPDDFYRPDIEFKAPYFEDDGDGLFSARPELALLWGVEEEEDIEFLLELQELHDQTDSKYWKSELREIENEYVSHKKVLIK